MKILFGNAVIENYSIEASLRTIPAATVSVNVSNFAYSSGASGIPAPGIDASIGHEGYGDATVGTGPMTFVERKEGVHVLFEALDEHWRKVPEFREFEFRWVQEPATRLATLLTEEVHMADIERSAQSEAVVRGMQKFSASKPGMFHKWHIGGQYYTEPDKLHPDDPMLNVKVRQAMNKSIDREAIVQALLPGAKVRIGTMYGFDPELDEAVMPGVINPQWAADWDEYYGYDLERAKALMVELITCSRW